MKKTFFFFAALVAVAACNNVKVETPSLTREVTIKASSAETKTQLSGDAVHWEANDAVALRFTKDAAHHVATFSTTQAGHSVQFKGTLPNTVSVAQGYETDGYAVYPATAMTNNGTISHSLPATVIVNENGSFDTEMNLSSAVVSLAELDANGTTEATFNNALSIVRFSLSASDIASLKISADGSNLAGTASMVFDPEADDRLVVDEVVIPYVEVTVEPTGDAFTAAKVYNVLVYPGTYTSLTAELTDTDGCKYRKTVNGPFNFVASNYYTFTFNTQFEKTYTFSTTGKTFIEGQQIHTVFSDLHDETLTADADGEFTGNLPAAVVHANTPGYAVYPATAYSAGKVNYTLDPQNPAELWSAKVLPTSESIAFTDVTGALATLQFTVPAGVKSVTIESTKGIVGAAVMNVTEGVLSVSGEGAGKTIELAEVSAQQYTLTIYPISEAADLAVTLKDAADKTVVKNFNGKTVAAKETLILDLSGELNFDKDGSFDNEGFVDGLDGLGGGNSIDF
ncbi:MAG: hypothetical protein IJ504_06015 [Bacteroidales bacterium]|nr:hypothetical protein [Bacteroidales bacterium]